MNIVGTILRQTEKAILFAGDPAHDTVFEGREIWWPTSQCTILQAGDRGPANTARLITSKWIAESKARELHRTAELQTTYAEVEAAETEGRRIKQAKSNGKKLEKELRNLLAQGVDQKEAWLRVYGHWRFRIGGEWWETLRTPEGDVTRKCEQAEKEEEAE